MGERGVLLLNPKQERSNTPAHKIADDIGMTDDDLIAVLLLLDISAVDVAAESGFDPGAVLVVLLRSVQRFTRPRAQTHTTRVRDTTRASGPSCFH